LSELIETTVIPEKQIYANGDFKIYACSTKDPNIKLNSYNNCSIKGVMPRLDLGVEYEATLELAEISERFGASYNCISIYQDIPETTQGQRDYLGTIMTENQLQAVLKVYPDDNIDIIELIKNKEFDYKNVYGFGEVVFERIYQKVIETLEYKEVLSKFGKYGITYETILKLAEELGGSGQLAVQKLEDDPYCLTLVGGWGFKRADIVAKKMGVKHDDPKRIQYGIKYTIEDSQQNGHTYMLRKDLLRSGCEILELSESEIEKEIENTDGLIEIEGKFSLQHTYNAEFYIAKKLKEMLSDNDCELNFEPEEFILRMEKKYDKKLTHQQSDFFTMFKNYRVGLLIGFAGTGKTQLQKFLVELLDELGLRYTFLSPSAQAAKVSTGYTGVKATTIHRKIGWGRDKKERMLIEIDEDVVIVDEAGMMDIFIENMLLGKIKNPKARILFVGDPFQLLSVQAGNFLHDAIESGVIPKTMLDIVFRQKEGGLLDIATKIRLGQSFVSNDFSGKQVYGKDFILHCVEQGHMESGYKHYYDMYRNKLEYEPKDIMVLSPTKKGNLGTVAINKYIQSEVNPNDDSSKKEHPYGEVCLFRTGDYILNTQNMYDICNYDDVAIELVNGDKGLLHDIVKDAEERLEKNKDNFTSEEYKIEKSKEVNKNGIVIDYTGLGNVRMNFNEIPQLLHAWCITIHKSQGDASLATLIVADKSHKFQLSANLIYTAITRSIEKGVLITQAETLNYAIRKVDNMRRQTWMQDLLKMKDEVEERTDNVLVVG
jgi:exodeoxyribonuclease V alpha subunit